MDSSTPHETPTTGRIQQDEVYYLSEILKVRVIWREKKIGKLTDIIAVEKGKIPEVTHFFVTRPFGAPPLYIPWEHIKSISSKEIVIDLENIQKFEAVPTDHFIMLKDHILDKKVLDMEDREVEIVYDIRMVLVSGRLFVSDVDFSRYGFLRRMGMKGLASKIYDMAFMSGARSLYSDRMKAWTKLLNFIADKIKDRTISWNYIQPLPTQLSSFQGNVKLKVLKEKLSEMPPVDLADILEELDHDQRMMLFKELDPAQASDTLEEIDPNVQRALVSSLQKGTAAQLINEMTPGQAADTLSVLALADANSILSLLNKDNAQKIRSILEKQEERILNYSTQNILKFSPDKTVAQSVEDYPKLAKGKDVIMYIYITDEHDQLLGILDLKELLQSAEESFLKDVMITTIISLNPESTLREASDLFSRYSFRAIPILDESKKLLGVVPFRDIMDLKHRFVE